MDQILIEAFDNSFTQWSFQQPQQEDWEYVVSRSAAASSEYLINNIEYYTAYLGKVTDCSIVIYENNKPLAVWPLTFVSGEANSRMQSNCQSVIPPLICPDAGTKSTKKIYQQCLVFLRRLNVDLGVTSSLVFDPIADAMWQRTFADVIVNTTYKQILLVDLSVPFTQLKQSFRKSYRGLINKGLKLWQYGVSNTLSNNELEEFRRFHIDVAGKETRTLETWQLQQKMVNDGKAFYVWLREPNNRLIGAALFTLSPRQASYSVGVYDREMFDQPLGHIVQFAAINHMQSIGVQRYLLGYRHHKFELPPPSEKESSIGFFKEGFSNQTAIEINADLNFR